VATSPSKSPRLKVETSVDDSGVEVTAIVGDATTTCVFSGVTTGVKYGTGSAVSIGTITAKEEKY
jgi:hypothetical protein